jgi:anti-sigma-K factor RskA
VSAEDHRGHGGCGEDAAPYVLGALTETEHDAFAAHLQTCGPCREEVSSLQAVANSLPAAVPQLRSPAALRDRVMVTVQSEAELRTAGTRGRRRQAERPTWRLALGSLAATAVAVVLAVLVLGGGSGGSTRVIRARVSAPTATATLSLTSGHGTLRIAGMPRTAPGHVYEVWLERAGRALPTDTLFSPTSAGTATVGVPGSLKGVKAVMVTAEPDGGSRQPTSKPVIEARIG